MVLGTRTQLSSARANRGYIFEAVFAAAIAARFYKRFTDLNKAQRSLNRYQRMKMAKDPSLKREEIRALPRVNGNDVGNMLRNLYAGGNWAVINDGRSRKDVYQGSGQYSTYTQPDVWFDAEVTDYLNVSIGVPRTVNNYIARLNGQYAEINDFLTASAAIVNQHSVLNSKVRQAAFNGMVDTISVTADGLVDQRTVKADCNVSISSPDPQLRDLPPFAVSCKVPGGEQFAQVSGGEWQQFETLFSQLGITISETARTTWQTSMQTYLDEGIFQRKYGTKAALIATNIPPIISNAAKGIYRDAAEQLQRNFPNQLFANYIVQGFSNGVDLDVIKLLSRSISGQDVYTGGKMLRVDDTFRQILAGLTYSVEYRETDYPSILIKAEGISEPVMQFRYKWENKSNKTKNSPKTYSMYPRHYLEALAGMFKVDERSKEFASARTDQTYN